MSSLTDLYGELNRLHWRGRLPTFRVRRAPLNADLLGRCDNARALILVRRDLAGASLRETLLHEMCHIGDPSGHGLRFQRKLRRLTARGETVMQSDVDDYDGSRIPRTGVNVIPLRDAVLSDLEALAQWRPRTRWSRARRLLDKYELSPARLERLDRWAEEQWRRISSEWREASK